MASAVALAQLGLTRITTRHPCRAVCPSKVNTTLINASFLSNIPQPCMWSPPKGPKPKPPPQSTWPSSQSLEHVYSVPSGVHTISSQHHDNQKVHTHTFLPRTDGGTPSSFREVAPVAQEKARSSQHYSITAPQHCSTAAQLLYSSARP